MGFRTLEISKACEIHIKEGQLEISCTDGITYVPIEGITHIWVHGANIRLSTMDLSILSQNKISITTLDEKYLPTAIVLPFELNDPPKMVYRSTKDRSGVLVGIRRIQESNGGNNHQVYSYKKIKQSHPRSATNISNNVGDTNKEYTTATDIVPSNESTVNTTGSKIRESRKSSVSAIEQAMLENEKMKQYIGSASKLAKLGITATGKQASS